MSMDEKKNVLFESMTENPKQWRVCFDALKGAGYTIEPDWQPIETAPKDGSRVLVLSPAYGAMSGNYVKKIFQDGGYWHLHGVLNNQSQPTHWKPLPTPPNKGEAA